MTRIDKSAKETVAVGREEVDSALVQAGASLSEASTDDDDFRSLNEVRMVPSWLKGDTKMMKNYLRYLGYSELVESASTMRLMQKMIQILRICKFDTTDIGSVLAVAAVHHKIFLSKHVSAMSVTERTFILLAQIYIAHCVVLDEYCSVTNWHKYLFASYCDLKSLNNAVARILRKLDWNLHVRAEQVTELVNAIFSC